MATAEAVKFCNVSEDLIKRFSNFKGKQTGGNRQSRTLYTTSPTRKKAALEQLLLSVPLDADVANFSDSGETSDRLNLPLYSDHYEPSFCLPSSGYRSDTERRKYRIRTCNSADQSPERSPERGNKNISSTSLRRSRSLNASTVTDRILDIRQKIAKSKKAENIKTNDNENGIYNLKTSGLKDTNSKAKTNSSTTGSSVSRSRSFNTIRTIENRYNTRDNKNLTSNSVTSLQNYWSNDKFPLKRQVNKTETKPSVDHFEPKDIKDYNTKEKPTLRSGSFTTLKDAWEHRRSNRSKNEAVETTHVTLSDVEHSVVYRRRERRRFKKNW